MKNSLKITVRYQFLRTILIQAAASGVTVVFGVVAFWYFTNINIAKQILSGVFILVNFAFLYLSTKKLALLDNKPYTPLKPSLVKGALLGVSVTVLNLIFMGIYALLWTKYGTETGINGILPTAYNAFYYLWSFPYNGIMDLNGASFTAYSVVIMAVMPPIATLVGYIAGCKKFNISEQLDKFMYEKEE